MNEKIKKLIKLCDDNNYIIHDFHNYSETFAMAIISGEDFDSRQVEYYGEDWE